MNEEQILENTYHEALKLLSENKTSVFKDIIRNDIDFLIAKCGR